MVSNVSPGAAPYAVHLEGLLEDSGRPALVWNGSTWLGMIDGAVRDWNESVLSKWPDLVVLQFGLNECRSILIPRRLHIQRWQFPRTATRRNRLWRRTLDATWDGLFAATRPFDREWVPTHMSEARFRALTNYFVELTRNNTNAVVAIIEIHPTTRILETLTPNYDVVRRRMQSILDDAVARNNNAFSVEITSLVERLGGPRSALPDGFHFSAQMHRLVAEQIAANYKLHLSQDRTDDRSRS
jgi:lysophospholipase L1-like esterase